ncbi:hypothetical protein [Marispirochaeta aestuarii]|nr:hypothetical protein [Marispirochaeta aestuarii]
MGPETLIFDESNQFYKKISYCAEEDPKSVLNRLRNSWAGRIAEQ